MILELQIQMRMYFVTASLILVLLTGCLESTSSTVGELKQPTLPTVEVVAVHRKPSFSFPVTYYGRITAARTSQSSFEMPGQIVEILADEGERVAAGQPLARLDKQVIKAERHRLLALQAIEQTILDRLRAGERKEQIAAARARVNQIAMDVDLARRDGARIKKLAGFVSESEEDSSEYRLRKLEASKASAEARLQELENGPRQEDIQAQQNRVSEIAAQVAVLDVRVSKTILRAPFCSLVTQRFVDEGTTLSAGDPVFELSEADRFEAHFSLPANQLAAAQCSDAIVAEGSCIKTRHARVVSKVSSTTRTARVVFELAAGARVSEGQSCALQLSKHVDQDCVQLPVSALVPSIRGLWSVYRLERSEENEHFVIRREEVLVNHSDGQTAFVESTMPDNSLIVVKGAHKVVPGLAVQCVRNK